MSDPTHAQLLAAIKGIEATLEERRRSGDVRRAHLTGDIADIKSSQADMRLDIKDLSTRTRHLEETAASGRSALNTSLKWGGAMAALVAGIAYIWEKFIRHMPH